MAEIIDGHRLIQLHGIQVAETVKYAAAARKVLETGHGQAAMEDGRGGGSGHGIAGETGSGNGEIMLELNHLSLEQSYGANATIYRVSKPGLSLIGKRIDSVLTLLLRDFNQDLAHIAGTKHLVNFGEFLGLIGPEVRCEYTIGSASPFQELASCTGGT